MRGVSSLHLKQLEGMSICQLIDMIEDFGYGTEGLSNDEIYSLAIGVLDGHDDEGDIEELDFGD